MRILIAIFCVFMLSCNASKKSNQAEKMESAFEANFTPGPPTIVYKTKADYSELVPVILSDDKKSIVSYPHPNDLKINDELRIPRQLTDEWLLDEKGINENVAYLNMTYQAYSDLSEVPSLDSLFSLIVDSDPIIEMCNCGNRNSFNNAETQLNDLINDGLLQEKCKMLKSGK